MEHQQNTVCGSLCEKKTNNKKKENKELTRQHTNSNTIMKKKMNQGPKKTKGKATKKKHMTSKCTSNRLLFILESKTNTTCQCYQRKQKKQLKYLTYVASNAIQCHPTKKKPKQNETLPHQYNQMTIHMQHQKMYITPQNNKKQTKQTKQCYISLLYLLLIKKKINKKNKIK